MGRRPSWQLPVWALPLPLPADPGVPTLQPLLPVTSVRRSLAHPSELAAQLSLCRSHRMP